MKKLANRHLFSIFMLAIVTVFYLFFAFHTEANGFSFRSADVS